MKGAENSARLRPTNTRYNIINYNFTPLHLAKITTTILPCSYPLPAKIIPDLCPNATHSDDATRAIIREKAVWFSYTSIHIDTNARVRARLRRVGRVVISHEATYCVHADETKCQKLAKLRGYIVTITQARVF